MNQHAISQLLDDIRNLEDTLAFIEGRILRKRIAVEELLASEEVKADAQAAAARSLEGPHEDQAAPPRVPVGGIFRTQPSATKLLESLLPDFNGATFWYPDLKKVIVAKHPEYEKHLRRSLYSSCQWLFKKGVLERCAGGMRVKVKV